MPRLTVDGNEVEVEAGARVLGAARKLGVEIPTLCSHKVIEPQGACRVCVVEIESGGRSRLAASCAYPAQDGLVVRTNTDRVINSRKLTLEFLLAQAPEAEVVREMARQAGVTETRFEKKEGKCILCGLCVNVCTEVVGQASIGFSGRGPERKIVTPYEQMSPVCIGCGACAFVCPTGAIDPAEFCSHQITDVQNEFNCGMDTRTPVYIPFPQAVPNKPVLDRDNCIHAMTGGCGTCAKICPADAIDYDTEDEFVDERVGAIIVATGYELADPGAYEEYGYGRYPDVVTSLEFERMVSASGPTGGRVVRPSDGKEPKTVVFIQCVGSREEVHHKPYCSKICCMYTAKHTMLLKHKVHDSKIYVFYMDVRAAGKNYEEFVRRVVKEKTATYLRGRVAKIFPWDGKLLVRGADTLSGTQVEIIADMVVLAAAVVPSAGVVDLAQKLRVGYDEHEFLSEAHPKLKPIETNTAGVMLAGACQSPKDIPETVAQASGAAAKALALISSDEFAREPIIGMINELTCNGCFECEGVCAYGAIEEKEIRKRDGTLLYVVAHINEGLCQGCGACAVTCRSKSIEVQGFTDEQMYAEVNAISR